MNNVIIQGNGILRNKNRLNQSERERPHIPTYMECDKNEDRPREPQTNEGMDSLR